METDDMSYCDFIAFLLGIIKVNPSVLIED